jgi:hypothetical protein
MEKAGSRAVVITRIQGPESDVCLENPIPGRRGTGPNGAWLEESEAASYLEQAIRANPSQRRELEALRGYFSTPYVDGDPETVRLIEQALDASTISVTDRPALIQARRGQGLFRDSLLAFWGACAVTGCREPALLRASHLKPWKDSTNAERLDPYNGLLLIPNLDSALDRGLIAFADTGVILLSPALSIADRQALGLQPTMKLRRLEAAHQVFLEYHRTNLFQSEATEGAAIQADGE